MGDNKYSIYLILDSEFNKLAIFDKPFEFLLANVKDFKLQIGYDVVKKRVLNYFVKPGTIFTNIEKGIIDKAAEQSTQEKKVKDQIINLKDYCLMTTYFRTISGTKTLQTPKLGEIDLKDLVTQFGIKYSNLVARDFTGETTINCKLKTLNNA